MKKIGGLLLFLLMSITAWPQGGIVNISLSPSPTLPDDSIFITATVWLPSQSCGLIQQNIYLWANTVTIEAVYTDGMMPAICTTSNVFAVQPLPAGYYILAFMMYYHLPTNLVATSSLNFTVGATGIQNEEANPMPFFPNPCKDQLYVEIPQSANAKEVIVEIYNMSGQQITKGAYFPNSNILTLDMMDIPPGLYAIRIRNNVGILLTSRIVKL